MAPERKTRFQHAPLEHALTDFVATLGRPAVQRAQQRLQFAVLASAWIDFGIWDPDVDTLDAIAWAWEGLAMALSGFGDSALTGVVVGLWSAVPRDAWPELKDRLELAKAQAEATTPATVPRRYLSPYRRQGVRTPEDGFNLPVVVPISGPRLREWAAKADLDADTFAAQLAWIEEAERLGLCVLRDEDTVLRAVAGGEGPDGEDDRQRRVPGNPYALPAAGAPWLRLVTTQDEE